MYPNYLAFCLQNRSFRQFFAIFLRMRHYFWLISHISIDLSIFIFCWDARKKNSVTLFLPILWPNLAFLVVIGHFLENASLVLASFAYFDRLDHSLHFLLKYHARKKSAHPVFGHFVSKLCVFCAVFKSHYIWKSCLVQIGFHVKVKYFCRSFTYI